MGFNIAIGEFYIDTEDSECHAPSAMEIHDALAPTFRGYSSVHNHSNHFAATYIAICEVFEKIGLYYYFTQEPNNQPFGGGGHTAVIDITPEIIDRFDDAVEEWTQRFSRDWWGLQVLEWFLYWCRFSYRICKRPVIVVN